MKPRLDLLTLSLCLVGIALSAVSLRSHYATTTTGFCDLNATFNCDIVNRSKFSEILGIPVAGLGIAGYAALLVLSATRNRILGVIRLSMAVTGMTFALYLAYIEEHVLQTWCLLCIGSLVTIAGIFITSILAMRRPTRSPV